MIERSEILNATGHIAIAGAVGVGTFVLLKISPVLFGAAIFGGSLAVYYGCQIAGKALGLKAYQVKFIQAVSIAVYGTALLTAIVATNIFPIGFLIGIAVGHLLIEGFNELRLHPDRKIHQALPERFNQLLFIEGDPVAERIEREEAQSRLLIAQLQQEEEEEEEQQNQLPNQVYELRVLQFVLQHLRGNVDDENPEVYRLFEINQQEPPRPNTDKIDFGKIYRQYLTLAVEDVQDEKVPSIRKFKPGEIADMTDSYIPINRLAIFKMIEGIQKGSTTEKIIFEKSELKTDVIPNVKNQLLLIRKKMKKIVFISGK